MTTAIRSLGATALLAAAVATSGCGEDRGAAGAPAAGLQRPRAEGQRVQVVAGFYPLYEAARAVGGDELDVVDLTPAGQGPHDLELSPRAAARLEEADVVLYLGSGFQPEVERAVAARGGGGVDLLEGEPLRRAQKGIPGVRGAVDGERLEGGADPHIWVDPARFARLVDRITAALVAAAPDRRAQLQRNARAYREAIAALDAEFRRGLRSCATRTLVTSHAAFGYLADRYDLVQAPIAGISPEAEPDPRSLAAVARRARADRVRTVFFESLVPRRLADTVAREIGARTDMLDPVEAEPPSVVAVAPATAPRWAWRPHPMRVGASGVRAQRPAQRARSPRLSPGGDGRRSGSTPDRSRACSARGPTSREPCAGPARTSPAERRPTRRRSRRPDRGPHGRRRDRR